MKYLSLAIALSLITLPQTVLAAPNGCSVLRNGRYQGEHTCWFYPAAGRTTLHVFSDSVLPLHGSTVRFTYMVSGKPRRHAKVTCNSARRTWEVVNGNGTIRSISVTTSASRRMLDYVCSSVGL